MLRYITVTMSLVLMPYTNLCAQRLVEREESFATAPPLVGDPLPNVEIYNADGTPFRTSDLKGHYTVLTFGCLTCPPSIWNIAELETVYEDYQSKGVQFYFVYKSLAHPELHGNFVQPFTLEERLAHASQAKSLLGTRIPWIVDAMDNRMKRALGDRPNSQFIVNPEGKIVVKRAWSNPHEVRQELSKFVGPSEKRTRIEELGLSVGQPQTFSAPREVVSRINRENMVAISSQPQIQSSSAPYFAKLRAEADRNLLQSGSGSLYLGFHLDPLYDAHWNNLNEPLEVTLDFGQGVQIGQRLFKADKVSAATDADPREFLVQVEKWSTKSPITLTVKYFACTEDGTCHSVAQQYQLDLIRDVDGGGAKGVGAGLWSEAEFSARLLESDRDGDQRLSVDESPGIIRPHFEKLDRNSNGQLERSELAVVTKWLNEFHRPNPPAVVPIE